MIKLWDKVKLVSACGRHVFLGEMRMWGTVGEQGVVIDIYQGPPIGYEVEIVDQSGRTVALVTAIESELEVVESQDEGEGALRK